MAAAHISVREAFLWFLFGFGPFFAICGHFGKIRGNEVKKRRRRVTFLAFFSPPSFWRQNRNLGGSRTPIMCVKPGKRARASFRKSVTSPSLKQHMVQNCWSTLYSIPYRRGQWRFCHHLNYGLSHFHSKNHLELIGGKIIKADLTWRSSPPDIRSTVSSFISPITSFDVRE